MSKPKVTQIRPTEQAPKTVPLADVRLTWLADDFTGRAGKPRTIDGAQLARLLHAVPEMPENPSRGFDGSDLAMHLDALRALMAALGESRFELDGVETAPYIFWMVAEYIRWLKLQEQWGDTSKLKAVLDSATVTIGHGAEEAPAPS